MKLKIFGALFLVELLSLLAFTRPSLMPAFFVIASVVVLVISLWDLRYGALISLAELFIGGMGYMLVWRVDGLNLSLRMVIFLILLAVGFARMIKDKRIEFWHSRFFTPYLLFVALIVAGIFAGYWRGNSLSGIFFDVNAFFFLAYLPIWYQAFKTKEDKELVWIVFWSATVWLALKTLAIFYFFTHGFSFLPWFYKWIRDSGVGEITPAGGGFYRVFLQSQIHLITGFILLVGEFLFKEKNKIKYYLLSVLFFSAILLSFSRSFWLGLLVALPLLLFIALVRLRVSGWQIAKTCGWLIGVLAGSVALMYVLVLFPYPKSAEINLADIFGGRMTVSDSAAATRWSELGPLVRKVQKNWFVGGGWGTTVTFQTLDPRLLKTNPDGNYTTSAFEWGWLDLWLKLGLIGLFVYGSLLLKLIKRGWANVKLSLGDKYSFGLTITLVSMIIVHFFTPYLNHPLGLGWLMLAIIFLDNRS